MNTMIWSMALAIALALAGAPGQAQGKLPRSVAEQRAKAETNGHWPSFRLAPGNVRAEDYHALLGNTVVVSGVFGATGIPRFALKVAFIGRDGRYLWCIPRREGRYFLGDQTWWSVKIKKRSRLWPIFENGNKENSGWGSPLYDAATGDAVWYGIWRGRWRAWDIGHHQESLPAIVWTLCPDFPSASELGVGVNQLQTAVTYDALLVQDRGRRILRPDLVTPNPSERAK